MFTKAVPLHPVQHAALKILESNDYTFARGEILSPFIYTEMGDVAREYPIVFPLNGSNMPAALMGLEAGKNAYVAQDGRWYGTYVPANIRRYPFAFAKDPQDTDPNRFVIVFDEDAPHFRDPNGHPVFTSDGQLTEHMKRRAALLENLQTKSAMTRRMVEEIDAAGILVERKIRINREGQSHQVEGLRVVDEQKLNRLPHDQFAQLRDKGLLPLIYAHLISWANFRTGPLAGMYPDLMAKPETRAPAFLFEDDDTFDFSKFS